MWHLYIFMGILTAGIVLKLVHPLIGRGRLKHGDTITGSDRQFLYALVGVIPLLSLFLYLYLGEPEVAGYPATLAEYQDMPQRHVALLSVKPFKTLVQKDPHNIGALVSLAQVNYRIKNLEQAISFYKQAVAEATAQQHMQLRVLLITLGEVQVEMNKGVVGKDAAETFRLSLTLYAESPIARYYLALEKAQDGKYAEAVTEWTELLEGGYPEIYWKKRVREKIAETRQKLP